MIIDGQKSGSAASAPCIAYVLHSESFEGEMYAEQVAEEARQAARLTVLIGAFQTMSSLTVHGVVIATL